MVAVVVVVVSPWSSGFFNNSVVLHDIFLEAVLWEGMWCAKNTHLRGHRMVGKNINVTPQTVRGRSYTATLHLARLHWSLLVFIGFHFIERNTTKNFLWYSGWFWPCLQTLDDLVQPHCSCWHMLLIPTDTWLVSAIELDCQYSDNKDWKCPEELLLHSSTTPISYQLYFSPTYNPPCAQGLGWGTWSPVSPYGK